MKIQWMTPLINKIPDGIGETVLDTMKQNLEIFLSCWSRFICYFCKCMGPQRRSVCCNFHYLSSLVLRVWERDVEDEKERKQEIAKNAKDDGEKKERGGGREGLSAERRFKVCKLANKSKGEVGLWILDFCSLTDNCGNAATTHSLHYTNDNKHVNSQRHSHSLL